MAIQHGTRSCYVKNRCRRPECKRASSDYEKERQRKKKIEAGWTPYVPTPLREMSDLELAWLAGLLEGEGTFGAYRSGASRKFQPVIAVHMTDLDVIEKVKDTTGLGGKIQEIRGTEKWKPSWKWQARERTQTLALMRKLKPLMGARRQAKIEEVLAVVV